MELHKLTHEIYEATRHWHLPLFLGLVSSFKLHHRAPKDNIGDFDEAPGDNFPGIKLIAKQ